MTFNCPGCGRSYRVPEEKFEGRAKRIRCRNCSEVFIIRPPKEKGDSVGEPQAPASAQADERASRFARVLASDMLVYNQDTVDKSRVAGNLSEAMAADLKRSWDLWKSRFPEAAARDDGLEIFRDALKKVLAAGGTDFDDWVPED